MVQLDKDWDIKKRIFDGVKFAMELETALNNVFGNNSKINALATLAIGISIKKDRKMYYERFEMILTRSFKTNKSIKN